jgi:tRNA threonylcarbamoyladenosine biosynthesis protein TsaB
VNILAFDTATPATTVALGNRETVELRHDPSPGERPGHATRLLPMISELMERVGAGWDSLDRIAVGVGPGTFTGLRVGIATAKALARAAGLPVVAVSTLQALALNARALSDPPGTVAAVLDARRGEAFTAAWRLEDAGALAQSLLGPRALAPQELANALEEMGPGVLAIGDGAVAFREVLDRPGVCVPQNASELHRVTATRHIELARQQPVTPLDRLAPDYQRPPDARPR